MNDLVIHQLPCVFQSIHLYSIFAKMKFVVIVFVVICAAAHAAPSDDSQATILKYEIDNIGIDGYKFA